MKKLFLTALLILALTSPCLAGDSGVYAGLKVMDSYQSTGDLSSGGIARHFDLKNHSQNTVGGGVFLGYDFFKQHNTPIRAEVEFAMRSTANSEYELKHQVGRTSWATMKAEYNMHTLFGNVYYDFHNDSAFTPYVGGGIGLAIIKSKYEIQVPQGSVSFKESNTSLAYNLGVGCSYDLTESLTADLAYRFVGTNFHETDKSLGGDKVKVGMANYANEFSLGLRFNF
ncbi:MAG: porin family protein [Desulfovibrio sp.]|nr:porin family protein [Desulfovibrio sp.]